MPNYELRHARMEELLPRLPEKVFDSVITDPPYELGFMGKRWDSSGVAFRPETWRHVLRVMKPGAHLLAFGGSRTHHRIACAIEDAGFEVVDTIMWVYGSGFPKSLDLGGGVGTALKPSHEPIVVARKPRDGTFAQNLAREGVGGMRIDDCRVPSERSTGPAGAAAGGNTWNKSNSGLCKPGKARPVDGRWPANFIHDGSDEVVTLFPSDAFAGDVDEEGSTFRGDSGSAARFFYCTKASRRDRDEGCEDIALVVADEQHKIPRSELNDPRRAGTIPRANSHPTVKPTALMRYLCRLVTPPGGIVLDPFFGSGSTGKAALLEGLNIVGVTDEAEHVAIARARLEHVLKGLK